MGNSHDIYLCVIGQEHNQVFLVRMYPNGRRKLLPDPRHVWKIGEKLKRDIQTGQIGSSLGFRPGLDCICPHRIQVSHGSRAKHDLSDHLSRPGDFALD